MALLQILLKSVPSSTLYRMIVVITPSEAYIEYLIRLGALLASIQQNLDPSLQRLAPPHLRASKCSSPLPRRRNHGMQSCQSLGIRGRLPQRAEL